MTSTTSPAASSDLAARRARAERLARAADRRARAQSDGYALLLAAQGAQAKGHRVRLSSVQRAKLRTLEADEERAEALRRIEAEDRRTERIRSKACARTAAMMRRNAGKAAAAPAAEDRPPHPLTVRLTTAIGQAQAACRGFLYLKVWAMPDGTRWYKIGITNAPTRRETEQNVLPVPAVTVKLVKLPSMEHARATEAAIHGVLDQWRIRGAGNRELFHMTDDQLAALLAALAA